MRPISLELCGINSFSEPAVIDFTKLLEFGIFGIFGDTGSGKSTILDCIGFALYGDIARSRSGVIGDVINYRQQQAYVRFEFGIFFEGKRRIFRAERTLRRKKDTAEQGLTVYERIDGKLIAVADGVREGNALLRKIVGLEQRDFEKCIALPQGEFAQFVKAPRGERLRIVSRLFDLEQYGEALVKRTNAYSQRLTGELNVLTARLEPYADVTAEKIALLTKEISSLEAQQGNADAACRKLRAEETRIAALLERYRAYKRAEEEMAKLEEKRAEMKTLNDGLFRLAAAGNVAARAGERAAALRRAENAARAFAEAEAALTKAKAELTALPPFGEADADARIAALERDYARAESAKGLSEQAEKLKRELISLDERIGKLQAGRVPFDYEKERGEIDELLSRMPEEDFLSFLGSRGKDALLRDEYAAVRDDFVRLYEKHTELGEDILPFIEKYTALSEGEREDIGKLKELFESRERMKKAAHEGLLVLEKRRAAYEADEKELARLTEERASRAEEASRLSGQLALLPPLGETEQALHRLREEKRKHAETKSRLERAVSERSAALAAATALRESAFSASSDAEEKFRSALAEGGFKDAEEAASLYKKYGNADDARARVEEYRETYGAAKRRLRELGAEDFSGATEEALSAVKGELSRAEEVLSSCTESLIRKRAELERDRVRIAEKAALKREAQEKRAEAETAERLKKLFKDNKFMEFIAEEYLQTVASNASGRLLTLTDGRYFLRYDGGFFVGDNFNGGALRAVYTLSGGETFLVSLSLALALSAEICLKSARPIEFFFLDEGFGTLDEKLVDTVMDSLEKLKSKSYSIGIISHVEELKHRIDRKLIVLKATERRGSQITAE